MMCWCHGRYRRSCGEIWL